MSTPQSTVPPASAPAAAQVEGIGLVKTYGSGDSTVHALRGVDIAIEKGRFTSIMGASGSGKSTLLHMLAGLDSLTEGRVLVEGQDITQLSDAGLTKLRRERIGFVFQSFNLLPMLTAEQNILLPLELAGQKPDRNWFTTVVNRFGLQERLDHLPSQMSGGQVQRTAIARALVSQPAVVFADEPTGNLDSATTDEVLDFLRLSVDEFGQTVVMVTHEREAAERADRIITMADGQIIADEPIVHGGR